MGATLIQSLRWWQPQGKLPRPRHPPIRRSLTRLPAHMSLRLLQPLVAAVVPDVEEEAAAEIVVAATIVVPTTEIIIILVKTNNKIRIRISSRVKRLTRRALKPPQMFPATRALVTGVKAEMRPTAVIRLSAAGPIL